MDEGTMILSRKLMNFIDNSPSPFHAVEEITKLLLPVGFTERKEADHWKVEPLQKFYVTKNKSSLFAVAVGGKYRPGNGFSIIAAHTDSPCLKLKPNSKIVSGNCLQVGVQTYGGGLWRTWFDRDLTVAGRILAKDGDKIVHKLVHIRRPILALPNLAIHLDRESNDKFCVNKEDHLKPILASRTAEELNKSATSDGLSHHSVLVEAVSNAAGVKPEQIIDLELCLSDTQPAALVGIHEEFISAPRLDNLVGSYTAVSGLIEACSDAKSLAEEPNVRVVICFDNEEVGSESAQGAGSSMVEWILRRLAVDLANPTAFEEAIPKSFLISADQAHAIHPNYRGKYEADNSADFHKGVVVKVNANQRYATTGVTNAILKIIASQAEVPLQHYVVRNDSMCGSTVGPILATSLGLQTVDVGTPQLAMHSIRELACTSGVSQAVKLYTRFFTAYPAVYESLSF